MSRSPTSHSFPASQALQLVELAARWGVSEQALLAPFGLDAAALEAPGARVSLDTLVELTARTRALTGEPGLGIYLGLQKHISAYGFVGFAAMSASTLGEALQQAIEFSPALTGAVRLSLRVEEDTAALVVHEIADVGETRDVALMSLFVGWRQITRDLTARELNARVELSIPEPAYFARFAHVLPDTRFDQPLNQIVFPARGLEVPLTRPNRAALNLAREQCRRQLVQLGWDGSLPGQVRRALPREEGFRSVDQVASALGLSERTLKRRLAAHGVSFSELLEDERKHRALALLRASALSLDDISERLGYATVSSFARAFARWTGQTPAAYRRQLPEAGPNSFDA